MQSIVVVVVWLGTNNVVVVVGCCCCSHLGRQRRNPTARSLSRTRRTTTTPRCAWAADVILVVSEMPRAAEKAFVGVGADFRRTPTGEHWVDDSTRTSCIACSKTFTLLRRRHHCRQCGEVFCGSCAPERQPAGLDTPMRLCKACARLPRSAPPAFAGLFRQISSVFCCAE